MYKLKQKENYTTTYYNSNGKSNFGNKDINPYPFIKEGNYYEPVNQLLTFSTNLENLYYLEHELPTDGTLENLGKYLDERNGEVKNIEMVVVDCSEALGCDPLSPSEIADYNSLIRNVLLMQGVKLGIATSVKIIRKPMKVYSHMDVDIPVQIKLNVEFTPKYKGENFVQDLSRKLPEPETKIDKGKSNNFLRTISSQKALLEKFVTYKDPISYIEVTRKAKESFYGIWYLDILNTYERELLNNSDYDGIVENMLYGIPMKVQCYDPEALGNLIPTIKSWSLIDMEAKIRYFNDGLDVRIGLDYGNVIKPEFYKRVQKAYEDEIIPLECWQTGVYVYPASKRVLDRKVHSQEIRDKMSEKDWDAAKHSGHAYVEKAPNENHAKMLSVFYKK